MTVGEKINRFVRCIQSIPDKSWEIAADRAVIARYPPYMFVLYQDGTFSVMRRLADREFSLAALPTSIFRATDASLKDKYQSACTLVDESEISAIEEVVKGVSA
jgi:hypothetical protein